MSTLALERPASIAVFDSHLAPDFFQTSVVLQRWLREFLRRQYESPAALATILNSRTRTSARPSSGVHGLLAGPCMGLAAAEGVKQAPRLFTRLPGGYHTGAMLPRSGIAPR